LSAWQPWAIYDLAIMTNPSATRGSTPSPQPPAGNADQPCPCGAGLAYETCCGRWHRGSLHLQAPTADALMRSRYSAYVLGLLDYVRDTWHPRTRPAQLESSPAGLKWLGLEVRRHVVRDDEHAEVEFVARSRLHGRAQRLHELSRFVREEGRWLYVDGDIR
jgi:SEC-C motif-containing protein